MINEWLELIPAACFHPHNQWGKPIKSKKLKSNFWLKQTKKRRNSSYEGYSNESLEVEERSNNTTQTTIPSTKLESLSAYDIAKKLAAEHLFGVANSRLYIYEQSGGYFRLLEDTLSLCRSLKNPLPETVRPLLTKNRILEIENDLISYKEFHRTLFLNHVGQERYMNFLNGVLDLQTMRVLEHHPDFHFDAVIQADFIEEKTRLPKAVAQFLNRICDGNKEKLRQIRCLFGMALSNIRSAKVAFFLIGPANCGKSTLLALLRSILGEENCSALSLKDFGKTFRLAKCYGKKANITAELPQEELQDFDTLKSVLGNRTDKLTAEIKFKDPFEFIPSFLPIFGGNTMPRIPAGQDPDEALRKRMYIIELTQSIPKNQQKPHVLEEMMEHKEAIIRWAVNGVCDFLENGLPPNTVDYDVVLDVITSDCLDDFVNECCDLIPDAWSSSADIAQQYNDFCDEMGIEKKYRASSIRIARYLKQLDGVEKSPRQNTKTRKGHGFFGIHLKIYGKWQAGE